MPYWSYYNNNREDADKTAKFIFAVIIISVTLGLLFPDVFLNRNVTKKVVPEKSIVDSVRLKDEQTLK
jgi:hypothetical protein